jgi:DnaJ-class molecular chaperone
MIINIDLNELYRDAEEDCARCAGSGIPECQTCHGSGKTLTYIGVAFFAFLRRHLNQTDAALAAVGREEERHGD